MLTSRPDEYWTNGSDTSYLIVYKPNVTCEPEIWDIVYNNQNVIVTNINGIDNAIETMQRRYL